MNLLPRRRAESNFQRAADGSMTLVEHLRELRSRLFKASLAVVAGLVIGVFFARHIQDFLNSPYCNFQREHYTGPGPFRCDFNARSPVDTFLLQLRIGLYAGLLIGSPVWLYQLWAFIAPGLHRRERRYTYAFTAVAVPLFAAGAFLAWFVVSKSLVFFLGMNDFTISIDLTGYFDFVTGVMLLFGIAFEFPLAVVMLNFAGLVSARRLLGWWRMAIFVMFAFAAVVTPTPDPFGMTALAAALGVLYFGAVFVAFLNDRRRARRDAIYAGLDDDQTSPLEMEFERVGANEPVGAAEPIEPPAPIEPPRLVERARPLDDRYDETT
jgi:sec-independent protein translocase protein TatC